MILTLLLTLQAVTSSVIQSIPQAYSNNYYEQLYRNYIIETNRQRIQVSNQQPLTFTLAVNKFILYSDAEFQSLFLTTRVSEMAQVVSPFKVESHDNNVNFSSNSILNNVLFYTVVGNDFVDIDWTRAGMVTPIKNQGGCGSCWAFAAVSDLESGHLLAGYRGGLDLSEQQLVDCSGTFFNFGCGGGWMTNAYAYIFKNPVNTEAAYPYTGTVNTCKNITGSFSLKNLRSYWQNKNCQLLVDILQLRPLSVAVAADSFYWGFYKSGILNQCSNNINHGVNLVGVKKSAT
jgi:C1A family cysteine protease